MCVEENFKQKFYKIPSMCKCYRKTPKTSKHSDLSKSDGIPPKSSDDCRHLLIDFGQS